MRKEKEKGNPTKFRRSWQSGSPSEVTEEPSQKDTSIQQEKRRTVVEEGDSSFLFFSTTSNCSSEARINSWRQ